MPAGTPAIFCVNDGETKLTCTLSYGMYFHINTNLNPVPAGELTLVGTFSELDITYREGFIIANDKFWNIQDIRGDNWVGIKPFRAYLAGSLSSGANSLGISFDDTEDVDAVEAISDVENGEMEYYDLNGRRLNRLQNGVNIVKLANGQTKKIIVE